MADFLQSPMEYLVRVGETNRDFIALSDPPLSEAGIAQAEAVAEFLGYEGIGRIEIPRNGTAALQFARILKNAGLETGPQFPVIKIMDMSDEVSPVGPGGIIAVYKKENGEVEFVPRLNVLPIGELN